MNRQIRLLLFPLILLVATGCNKIEQPELALTTTNFNVGEEEETISVSVNSNAEWQISSDSWWCTPSKRTGIYDETIPVSISKNITGKSRKALLTVSNRNGVEEIIVEQKADNGAEHHYKLPIVFHVLYNDKSNRNQYVDKGWIAQLVNTCNDIYANRLDNGDPEKKGTDINLEFVLATTDPQGTPLEEPGVNRIYWNTPVMDCNQFMSNPANAALIWDLNRYINIMVYEFTENGVLGISHIAYSNSAYPLDGLYAGNYYFSDPKPTYPHCVSINNASIYSFGKKEEYETSNITTTLAHELGHYLGLFHAFGVDEPDQSISWKKDTDYCEDTPNYNRDAYENWLINYFQTIPAEKYRFSDIVMRTDINGKRFVSRNIMDYAYSWENEFTPEQRKRIRHVLEYSPLIPGPKRDIPLTRNASDTEIPEMRTIK